MTTAIKLKKSSVVGRIPASGDIVYGELAINFADGRLFYKNSSNDIRSFLDSGQTISLIDSDYVNARVVIPATQNVFSTIAVAGQSDVVADATTDTLTFVAGNNITITTNDAGDAVTFASSGAGSGVIGSANQVLLNTYTGDSSTTAFTLAQAPISEQHSFVTINGVAQHTSAYSISGTTLTLSEAPLAGDDIEVRTLYLQTAEVELRNYASYTYQPSSALSTFADSDINGNVLSYGLNKLDVYLNGARLVNGLDYTATNESSITLLGGAADSGDTVAISSFSYATIIDPLLVFVNKDSDYSTTSQQLVDTFAKSTYRTAKFLVQLEHDSDSKYQATEILITHNGTTVFMTEYATIATNGILGTFDADISGLDVRLLVTPALTNTSVKSKRISVEA